MAPASRRRILLFRCVLVAGGLSLALGLGEILLRLMGVAFPAPYLPDIHTGSRLQPGWSGWFTKEGRAFVTINGAGFRDRDHLHEKPHGTLRVLVLGDSYVEALQVARDETFWSVVEQELRRDPPAPFTTGEVIAMGVSGWGTAQQFEALRHYGLSYHPDLVILSFLAANDVRNNSRELEEDPCRPYYDVVQGDLRLDLSFRDHPRFQRARSAWTAAKVALLNRSRLLQLVQECRRRWRYGTPEAESSAAAGLDDACFREPATDTWKRAWEVTERLIQEMHAVCRQRSIRFSVMTVTHAMQVHPDPARREAFQRRLGVDSLGYADQRIGQLAETVGFPVIRPAEPLRQYAERHGTYLHGFVNMRWGEGHWNATGHRLAGQIVAKAIRSQLAAETDPSAYHELRDELP